MKTRILIALVSLASIACAKSGGSIDLRPAAGAEMTGAPGEAAVAASAGVEVTVNSRAWTGALPDLPRSLTPMFVRIENNSGSPVEVRYDQLALVNDQGESWRAIPPMALDGRVRSASSPHSNGFAPAPHLRDGNGPVFTIEPTSTGALVEQALPEGIVAPGTSVGGFVYFQGVRSTDLGQIDFQARILDAREGGQLALVEIPFITEDAFIGFLPDEEQTAAIEDDEDY